jgi:hypothetical protein
MSMMTHAHQPYIYTHAQNPPQNVLFPECSIAGKFYVPECSIAGNFPGNPDEMFAASFLNPVGGGGGLA